MRILIVDDNQAVRRGVEELISSCTAWRVCGHASDGAEGLKKAAELRPDVVLLDVSMPGASGLEVASKLRREIPEAAIIMMTQHDPIQMLPRAIEAGAHACVDKSTLSLDLLRTIEDIARKPKQSQNCSESDTNMCRPFSWREAYMAAVFETDNRRAANNIREAKAAIERRLESPIEMGSEERRELAWAQRALRVLETERLTKPS